MRGRGAGRALKVLLIALAAVLLGRALAPRAAVFESPLSPPVVLAVGTLGKTFFLFLAAAVAALNVGKFEAGTPARAAWRLLAWGFAAFFLGQATLAVYQLVLGIETPFPSVADVFFLLSYPAMAAALVTFLRAYAASGFPAGTAGERAGLAAGTALLCAAVIYPILAPAISAPAPLAERLLSIAYPVLDVLLLIPTVLLIRISLRFRGGAVWRVWAALLGGFVLLAAADLLFAWLSLLDRTDLVDPVDLLYLLGYGCLGLGVLYQRELLE